MLWSITKGSLVNKLIIVPVALLLSAFFPPAITIILILGGFYLAYEGVEKIIEFFFHRPKAVQEVSTPGEQNDRAAEKAKIKAAVTTDFILSIEIVIMALGTVLTETLPVKIITVSIVAVLATIGVYGIVALIVRMDDAGYHLIKSSANKGFFSALGHMLVKSLPLVIKLLGFAGTIALILVAGGIFLHDIAYLHHLFAGLPATLTKFALGLVAGLITVTVIMVAKRVRLFLK